MAHKRLKNTHQLLQAFTRILYEHDLMGFNSPNELEYEFEAVTILDKLLRSDVCDRIFQDEIRTLSEKALKKYIKKTFKFWFGDQGHIDVTHELITELLNEYQACEDDVE